MDYFDREELIVLREKAYRQICEGMNESWVRAWENLAMAADHLDAMLARCQVPPELTSAMSGEST